MLRLGPLGAVFAGGSLGGLARWLTVQAWPAAPGTVPWPTLVINLSGAFLLGVLVARLRHWPLLASFAATGFCGAFTTFAALTVATDRLWSAGHLPAAAGYLIATVLGGVLAAEIGLRLAGARPLP